jgi:hypothetical protein
MTRSVIHNFFLVKICNFVLEKIYSYTQLMNTQRDRNIQQAQAILDWNKRNLKHDTHLTEMEVAHCFGDCFIVEPNGRHYEASAATYLEFLTGMKRSMQSIDYDILHTVADDESVLFDMVAHISHTDGRCENFIAMLLMRFGNDGKLKLWKEVYLPQVE